MVPQIPEGSQLFPSVACLSLSVACLEFASSEDQTQVFSFAQKKKKIAFSFTADLKKGF